MENEYMKRGFLLPEGCKDLIDVLKLKEKAVPWFLPKLPIVGPTGTKPLVKGEVLPPFQGEIVIPAHTTVAQLAVLLKKRPFVLIADLMQIGIFATVSQVLDFETVAKLARKYGFLARSAD